MLVDDPDIAVRRQLAANISRQIVQNAVQRNAVLARLNEIHRLIGVDIKALPVDDDLLAGLVDRRCAAACGNRRATRFDHAALRPRCYFLPGQSSRRSSNCQNPPQSGCRSKRATICGGQINPERFGR